MTLEETQPSQTDNADDDEDDEDAADMEAFEVSGMLDEQDKVRDKLTRGSFVEVSKLWKMIFRYSIQHLITQRRLVKRNGTRSQRGRSFVPVPTICTLHMINIIKRLGCGCLGTMR